MIEVDCYQPGDAEDSDFVRQGLTVRVMHEEEPTKPIDEELKPDPKTGQQVPQRMVLDSAKFC